MICIASSAIHRYFERGDVQELSANLAGRGIDLVVDGESGGHGVEASAILIGSAGDNRDARLATTAREKGLPILRIEPAAAVGLIRIGELSPDLSCDTRLTRLMDTHGRNIGPETVHAAAGELPRFMSDGATATQEAASIGLAAVRALPAPWRQAFEGGTAADALLSLQQRFQDPAAPDGAAILQGESPELWPVLGSGREVVTLGASPVDGTGLAHSAHTPEEVPAALASLARRRRNVRDLTRRAFAVERVFNTFAPTPAALAAALDAALLDVGRPPGRSVSIVITNFNYRDYLMEAVASALCQTIPPLEVIVVDDGSTDGSADAVEKIDGVTLVAKPNGGQASAFNAGFAKSRGDLILFLDADDRLKPDAVKVISQFDYRGISRLGFPLATIDAAGRTTGLYKASRDGAPPPTGFLGSRFLHRGIFPFIPTSGNAFPRAFLDAVLPMPEQNWRISADLYLVLSAAMLGDTASVTEILGEYRIHGENHYFDPFGSGLHLGEGRRRQRLAAWEDLEVALHKRFPPGVGRTYASGLRDLWTRTVTVSSAASQAELTAPSPTMATLPTGGLREAGTSTWPRLDLSREIDVIGGAAGVLGSGWTIADREAQLDGIRASLAFRVPETNTLWRLAASYRLDERFSSALLEVWVNGVLVEVLQLNESGTLVLEIPRSLLATWGDLVPHVGPGALAACITLVIDRELPGGFALETIRLDPVLPLEVPSVPAAPGSSIDLSSASLDAGSLSPLGEGWDWPTGDGTLMTAARAFIHLTQTVPGPAVLVLNVEATGLEVFDGSPPFEVEINGVPAATSAGEPTGEGAPRGGAKPLTFCVTVPPDAVRHDGLFEIALSAVPRDASQAWPSLRAKSVRVECAPAAGEAPPLVLSLPVWMGPVVEARASRARGLVASGSSSLIIAEQFFVRLSASLPAGPIRVELRIDAEYDTVTPRHLHCSVGEREVEALIGASSVVPIDLPPAEFRPPFLSVEGTLEPGPPPSTLRTVTVKPLPLEREQHVDADRYPLGPSAIMRCAVDPSAWTRADDDALWLRTCATRLRLPPLPPGTRAVVVALLTLCEHRQELRFCGPAVSPVSASGHRTVELPVDGAGDSEPFFELEIASSLLVSADILGLSGRDMLGGALLSIQIADD